MLSGFLAAYTAVKTFFGDAWNKLVLYGALTLGALVILWQVFRMIKDTGRNEAIVDSQRRALTNVEKANEARARVETTKEVPADLKRFYID